MKKAYAIVKKNHITGAMSVIDIKDGAQEAKNLANMVKADPFYRSFTIWTESLTINYEDAMTQAMTGESFDRVWMDNRT